MANRSISREQIKNQIKKVVYHVQDQKLAGRHYSEIHDLSLPQREETGRANIRTSLTPKRFQCPKKQS